MTDLRIRVRDDLYDPPRGGKRRIEVLDPDGNVLGDLAKSVSEVRWTATNTQLGILSIDLAAERAGIDTI